MRATTLVLLFLLAALRPSSCQIVSSIRPEIPVKILPGDTRLNTFTFLTCLPEPSTLNQSDYVSHWTIPSGVTFTSMTNLPGFERFRVSQGGVTTPQGNRQSTLLIVLNLTYEDAGNYTCEVRSSLAPARSPWLSTSVELQLEVDLQATVSNVTAHSNDTEVELACEMTLFIRPDENLQWFRGSEMIVNGTNRHTVSYHNGSVRTAQYGGDTLIPGRVSVLTISNPQLPDSGTYTCRILGTEQSANVQLSVEDVFPATSTRSVTATATPTEAIPTQSAFSATTTPSVTGTTIPSTATPIQNTFPPTPTPSETVTTTPTFPAPPTPSKTATTTPTPTQSVTPRGPGGPLSTEIIGVLVVIGLITLALITIATIIIIAVFAKRKKDFKMAGKGPNYFS